MRPPPTRLIVEMPPALTRWRDEHLTTADKKDTSAQIEALYRGENPPHLPYARSGVTLLVCEHWYVKYRLLSPAYVEHTYGAPNWWGIKVYAYIPTRQDVTGP